MAVSLFSRTRRSDRSPELETDVDGVPVEQRPRLRASVWVSRVSTENADSACNLCVRANQRRRFPDPGRLARA
ncbi:hypothetical protein D8S78_12930 [Natrialba swarupiae]|nr:hypothetical protein [Natrialba swarupiae]